MLIETDTSGADAKEEVPLKPEQKGFVVGKAGATISRLQAESGARLRIDPNTHVLTILGSKGQVRARGAAAAQHAHAPRATRTRSPCGFPPLVRACACAHGQVGKAKKMVDDVLIEQASSFADGGGAWSAAGGPTQDISLKPEQCAPVIGCSAGLRTKLLWVCRISFSIPGRKSQKSQKKSEPAFGSPLRKRLRCASFRFDFSLGFAHPGSGKMPPRGSLKSPMAPLAGSAAVQSCACRRRAARG